MANTRSRSQIRSCAVNTAMFLVHTGGCISRYQPEGNYYERDVTGHYCGVSYNLRLGGSVSAPWMEGIIRGFHHFRFHFPRFRFPRFRFHWE